jgi:peptidoglycan/LPS O-acetylase OafA/YrhL
MAADRSLTIDGLRGIAAMAVIVQHCLEFTPINNLNATTASPIEYIFANDFNLGRFGVIIFFLISGFLIPSSIGRQPKPLVSFAIGRFFRLYPLYWVSIIFAVLTLAALGNALPSLAETIANITMFQMLFGYDNILYPYWTLLIEHFFYITCVTIFLFGSLHDALRMRTIMLASGTFIILLALILTVAPSMRYTKHAIDLLYILSFLFVMIVGHNIRIAQETTFEFPIRITVLFAAVYVFVFVARSIVGGYSDLLSPTSMLLSTLSGLLVFLTALRIHSLRSKIFVYIGQISYGLYLFHGIALWIAIALIAKPKDLFHSVLLLFLVFGITFITSAATFRCVEEPFIALGKAVRRNLVGASRTRRDTVVAGPIPAMAQDVLQPFNKSGRSD